MNEALINLAVVMVWGLLLLFAVTPTSGFVPLQTTTTTSSTNRGNFVGQLANQQYQFLVLPCDRKVSPVMGLQATPQSNNESDEDDKGENPYNDPNYPELEFVDYSDPEYVVDQGIGDDFFDPQSTEEKIEEMREDRRRRNDEFQFQTYFKELLKEGREYHGEWSVYQTSTFVDSVKDKALNANGFRRFLKSSRPLYVKSKAYKSSVETDSIFPTDAERIHHEETIAVRKVTYSSDDDDDDDDDDDIVSEAEEEFHQSILTSSYWPEKLSALDFRGEKGIMCVGSAYTICTTVSLNKDDKENPDSVSQGPFAEYRAEMGILDNDLRFRIKLDYRIKEEDKEAFLKATEATTPAPPLCLKSLVVCREMLERWPPRPDDEYNTATEEALSNALYGRPGAAGGLYDPPPVGSEDQAGRYMLLDLEGGATILFPYEIDQDPGSFDGNGWVTSLDWTPGIYRYQVDRKVRAGSELRNLRTLELSEVQSADADQYRPRDGGSDMRQ